jgi:hypothetical protein
MICELLIISSSLFESKQMSTNHVSTSNHSRAKNQVNKILYNVFSPFRGFSSNVPAESDF